MLLLLALLKLLVLVLIFFFVRTPTGEKEFRVFSPLSWCCYYILSLRSPRPIRCTIAASFLQMFLVIKLPWRGRFRSGDLAIFRSSLFVRSIRRSCAYSALVRSTVRGKDFVVFFAFLEAPNPEGSCSYLLFSSRPVLTVSYHHPASTGTCSHTYTQPLHLYRTDRTVSFAARTQLQTVALYALGNTFFPTLCFVHFSKPSFPSLGHAIAMHCISAS